MLCHEPMTGWGTASWGSHGSEPPSLTTLCCGGSASSQLELLRTLLLSLHPPTLSLSPLPRPYCRGLPGPPHKHFRDLEPPLSSPPPPAPPSPSTHTPLPWAPGPGACPSLTPLSLTPPISFPGLRAETTPTLGVQAQAPPAPGPAPQLSPDFLPSPPPTSAPDFPDPGGGTTSCPFRVPLLLPFPPEFSQTHRLPLSRSSLTPTPQLSLGCRRHETMSCRALGSSPGEPACLIAFPGWPASKQTLSPPSSKPDPSPTASSITLQNAVLEPGPYLGFVWALIPPTAGAGPTDPANGITAPTPGSFHQHHTWGPHSL